MVDQKIQKNNKKMNSNSLIFSLMLLFFSSVTACSSIEGEEICGTWNASGDYGEMTVEITPWQGKFHGYLMEYKNGNQRIKGEKKEDYIFLTDLVNEGKLYQNGKIYLDPNSEESCGITLEMLDENRLKALYDCKEGKAEEIWQRAGTGNPLKGKLESVTADNTKNSVKRLGNVEAVKSGNSATKIQELNTKKELSSTKSTGASTTNKNEKLADYSDAEELQKGTDFAVIGYAQLVDYSDVNATAKAVENLWTKLYDKDFSNQLTNITEAENAYVVYSNYENPKGKMTVTIGYKVADLSKIPTGLNGLKISANDYLVYPLSGEISDYEGEGWDLIEEMMMYRNPNSVDYEVYTFDQNYKVKDATIWIATK